MLIGRKVSVDAIMEVWNYVFFLYMQLVTRTYIWLLTISVLLSIYEFESVLFPSANPNGNASAIATNSYSGFR